MKFTAFSILALGATLVSANTPASQCSVGNLQCCQSSGSASNAVIAALLGSLGIPIGSVTGLVGVTCDPITVIGGGSVSCSAQPVCCTNNSFNGVVALGCDPVDLSL